MFPLYFLRLPCCFFVFKTTQNPEKIPLFLFYVPFALFYPSVFYSPLCVSNPPSLCFTSPSPPFLFCSCHFIGIEKLSLQATVFFSLFLFFCGGRLAGGCMQAAGRQLCLVLLSGQSAFWSLNL